MTVKEFLNRYDNKEVFNEDELREIFNGDLDEEEGDYISVIEESYGEPRRWSRFHHQYLKINDRYFYTLSDEGLAECQDSYFDFQPKEVGLKVETKTIVVTENVWTPIERK
jgi:hypothetical protein